MSKKTCGLGEKLHIEWTNKAQEVMYHGSPDENIRQRAHKALQEVADRVHRHKRHCRLCKERFWYI